MAKTSEAKEKFDVAKVVTDRIIEALEAGTVPWRKPWVDGQGPTSMANGKRYRGINTFLLGMTAMAREYKSPFWGTYNNIAANGGAVRKGEKSTLVVFYKMLIVDDAKKPGEKKKIPMLRYFRVFNADQCDWPEGMPPRFVVAPREAKDAIEECEEIVAGYVRGDGVAGPQLVMGGNAAFYVPISDQIHMPERDQFDTSEHYYSTLFHEMTHSTGAKNRLAREGVTNIDYFGSHQYSKEELIAEMGAAMLSATAGIDEVTINESAAYLDHWIKVLKGDVKLIISAASAAQKAMDKILGQEVEYEETAGAEATEAA